MRELTRQVRRAVEIAAEFGDQLAKTFDEMIEQLRQFDEAFKGEFEKDLKKEMERIGARLRAQNEEHWRKKYERLRNRSKPGELQRELDTAIASNKTIYRGYRESWKTIGDLRAEVERWRKIAQSSHADLGIEYVALRTELEKFRNQPTLGREVGTYDQVPKLEAKIAELSGELRVMNIANHGLESQLKTSETRVVQLANELESSHRLHDKARVEIERLSAMTWIIEDEAFCCQTEVAEYLHDLHRKIERLTKDRDELHAKLKEQTDG